MMQENILRKSLDNQQFLGLRLSTEKIAQALNKRLIGHLEVLRPLFLPKILLGSYVKTATMEEIPGADKAFASLQERFAAICEKPFGLPKKLPHPLPPISSQLEANPLQYFLYFEDTKVKPISVTSPARWIISYGGGCPLNRLRAMVAGTEPRQLDDMRQGLINHLTLALFLQYFPSLNQLFVDLRYQVETRELMDLGGVPVVVLKAPVETFLPPDNFIQQITQLSGIAAFQEIIDPEAVEKISDPLKEYIKSLIS